MVPLHSTTAAWSGQVDHHWGRLPNGRKWGTTHGVAVAADGSVHVLHTGGEAPDAVVEVFTPDGTWLRAWGEAFHGSGHGLWIGQLDGDEVALVTDQRRGLFCCDLDGTQRWRVAKPAFYRQRNHLTWAPSNLAVDTRGQIHLSDGYGSYVVTVLNPDGSEAGQYGGPGLGAEHLIAPHGIAAVRDGEGNEIVVVLENRDAAMHGFTIDGAHRFRRNHPDLIAPRHLTQFGEHWLIPDLSGFIGVWTPAGDCVARLGATDWPLPQMFERRDDPPDAMPAGRFVSPHDCAVGHDGSLYVVEWVSQGRVSSIVWN